MSSTDPRPGPDRPSLEALATVMRGSAVPYGYTLTVLSSHSIVSHSHGPPTVFEILLFVGGGIGAFAALALLSQRFAPRPRPTQRGDLVKAGMIHVFAIGAAFGATVLIGLIPGIAAWPLAAFAATALYLSIASLEIDLAHRINLD